MSRERNSSKVWGIVTFCSREASKVPQSESTVFGTRSTIVRLKKCKEMRYLGTWGLLESESREYREP